MAGETFILSSSDIWVKPTAFALAFDSRQAAIEMDGAGDVLGMLQ